MTRLTPDAQRFRAIMESNGPDWPQELLKAATLVRCELDGMRLKSWELSGGPKKLGEYLHRFERLYDKHMAASLPRG